MSGSAPANILMVDDQPARLLTYRAILEPLGHNLVAVNSGLEALDALMKQEFAVVLLDVPEDRVDGQGRVLHQAAHGRILPVSVLTFQMGAPGGRDGPAARARGACARILTQVSSRPPCGVRREHVVADKRRGSRIGGKKTTVATARAPWRYGRRQADTVRESFGIV